jgi:putative spermidine/putrescine transport system permease protein
MRGHRGALLYVWAAMIGLFLMLPAIVIIPASFSAGSALRFPPQGFSTRWYANFFTSPMWTSAAITSVKVAGVVVVLATVLGTATALGMVRGRYPGRAIVTALVLGPMIVPIVVLVIGMYFFFLRLGLVGSFLGVVIAHSVLALPFVVVPVGAALRGVDPSLELAAQNLGAGPGRTFLRITLPLILPAVAAGAVFAFVTSFDEVVAALFLTSPSFVTLPVVMWGQARAFLDPTLAAVSSLLMGITSLALVAVLAARLRERAVRRR